MGSRPMFRELLALHLEGGHSRARVQLDLILGNGTHVQGGHINGFVLFTVRKKGDDLVMLSEGRMRVIGFESILHEKERAVFYEYSVPLSSVCQNLDDLYRSGPNDEGFMLANEGQFTFSFSIYLEPEAISGVPKGSFPPHSGVALRYILMASIRIKDPISEKKSMAHFYRDIHVWPCLDLAFALTPLPRPIQVTMSGIEGALKLNLTLQRLQWFAGQQCHLKFYVVNNTSKHMKTLTVELHRDTITCRPRGDPAVTDDLGGTETSITSKIVLVSTLSAGERAEKGYASTKGWWTGVLSGESLHFHFSLLLPPDALSVTKGQLLEIEYRVKATISSGSLLPTELSAEVPIRIINFISVDPPPSQATTTPALMSQNSAASNATLPGPPYSAILAATLNPGSGAVQRENSALGVQELVVPPPMTGLDSGRSRSDAGRFADLYYKTLQKDLMQKARESRSSKGFNDLPTGERSIPKNPPEMNTLTTQDSIYSQATFHTGAVEVGHSIESSIPVGGVLPPSMLSTHISFPDRTWSGSPNGLNTPVDAQKRPEVETSPSSTIGGPSSRKLPEPPSAGADMGISEEMAKDIMDQQSASTSRSTRPPLRHRETSAPGTLSGMRSAYSMTWSPLSQSVISVKDKIKELEERVKAIEYSATAPT